MEPSSSSLPGQSIKFLLPSHFILLHSYSCSCTSTAACKQGVNTGKNSTSPICSMPYVFHVVSLSGWPEPFGPLPITSHPPTLLRCRNMVQLSFRLQPKEKEPLLLQPHTYWGLVCALTCIPNNSFFPAHPLLFWGTLPSRTLYPKNIPWDAPTDRSRPDPGPMDWPFA